LIRFLFPFHLYLFPYLFLPLFRHGPYLSLLDRQLLLVQRPKLDSIYSVRESHKRDREREKTHVSLLLFRFRCIIDQESI
jgi:hypothetical protein